MGSHVPIERPDVREALDRELLTNTYWHSNTLLLLKRANKYFPIIDSILKEEMIPADFKYLAVAESSLMSNAVSPSKARGYWQFLKHTAREYGLKVNKEVDERRHLIKSTIAACRYFHRSYSRFGDWALVAASYNAGVNKIRKLLRKQKVESYFDLQLNSETSRYVYRILALKLVIEDPKRFGFEVKPEDLYEKPPMRKIKVRRTIKSWVNFAKRYGINYKLLRYYNPWIISSKLTNKRKKTYYISVPNKR